MGIRMNTDDLVRNQLARTFAQSATGLRDRLAQNDDQQTSSAIFIGARKVKLPNGDIRTADFQGTRQVAIGESVTVTFPLGSQIGQFTSKIA